MTRQTFTKVCRVLEPDLSPMENTVRDVIDVQKQVALAIYLLATPTEVRTIGNLFCVEKSAALKCIHRVCEALVENLLQEFVTFPIGNDLKDVKDCDETWRFSNYGGVIDGTHVPIIGRSEEHGYYLKCLTVKDITLLLCKSSVMIRNPGQS